MSVFIIDVTRVKTDVVVYILERVKCHSFSIEIIGVFPRFLTSIVELTKDAFVLEVSLSNDVWFSRTRVLELFIVDPLACSASVLSLVVPESTSDLLQSVDGLLLWSRSIAASTRVLVSGRSCIGHVSGVQTVHEVGDLIFIGFRDLDKTVGHTQANGIFS